jgi:hypothetical protein
MMRCAGLHCGGCKEAGGAAAVALAAAAGIGGIGATVSFILANIVLIAVGALVSATAVGTLLVRLIRRELHSGHTWHGEARTLARVNGAPAPAAVVPARVRADVPVLTADQISGLAELGQFVHNERAAARTMKER